MTQISDTGTTTFAFTGVIQMGTITTTGYYDIVADGAQGGSGVAQGGLGAMASGVLFLQAGAVLEFIVGGQGVRNSPGGGGGGGGGGSFVIEIYDGSNTVDVNEVIAGGGGGGGGNGGQGLPGGDGQAIPTGGNGGVAPFGAGGTNGQAGAGGGNVGGYGGGGGGGFTGGAAGIPGHAGSTAGISFAGGGGYGIGGHSGVGGFGGGGGGTSGGGGGGGGGYGGGGGGSNSNRGGGGGGGSFVNATATNVTQTAGSHGGNGLITITFEAPVCFLSGTSILTQRGEVAVEDLRVGDPVVALVHGGLLPVRWIGNRRVRPLHYRNPDHAHPIRVQEGAFGPGMPHRDLWLTPGHRVLVDGHLVQIDTLLNDTTIEQVKQDEIHVFHIELDRHDVILADGMPSETFLDVGNRAVFEDGPVVPLDPDFMPHDDDATCLPVQRDPAMLAALRTRLEARAEALGWTRTEEAGLHLLADGRVVEAERDGADWVLRLDEPATEVWLMSRWYVPAHQETNDLPDPRRLGVAVASLAVDGRMHDLRMPAEGWHKREADQGGYFRWTSGRARLPSGRIYRLRLVHPRQYWRAGGIATLPRTPTHGRHAT
ncbi:MAG: Hint domain-containing protein [Acetobacteraceae bacterium]